MLQESAKKKLKEEIALCVDNPLRFVQYAYPWGKSGTMLEGEHGPDRWQYDLLKDLGHAIRKGWVWNNGEKKIIKNGRIWIAVRSGHGIGKSTLMAWLEQWFDSVHPLSRTVTTANTENQLRNKTWMEMAKWHDMLINKSWFELTATKYSNRAKPNIWFGEATPWSEHRTQGFAGTHARYVMYKFDEASEIPDAIWEVAEGAMTDLGGLKIWIVFGNPTMNTGRFHDCFGKERSRWITYEIDARTSKRTDKELIEEQIRQYGEDSDFVRVRIKGQPPRGGTSQFLPPELVEKALGRHIHPNIYMNHPKIMGVDIARDGMDRTVFIVRQGLAAYGLQKFSGLKSLQCAGLIAQEIQKRDLDAVFLDMGNIGAAVYDDLVSWGYKDVVTGVWFSTDADDPHIYFNKRAEMGGRVEVWLEAGGCLPYDTELRDDMQAPKKLFSSKEQIQMESSKDMKARGVASPDHFMSLGLTFAYPVAIKKTRNIYEARMNARVANYDMLQYHRNDGRIAPPQQAVDEYNMLEFSR